MDLIDGFLKLDGGKHIHKRSFQSHRCRALRLVPAADDDSRTGLDGEAVPSGAIQAEIFPGALRVFCAAPAVLFEPKGFLEGVLRAARQPFDARRGISGVLTPAEDYLACCAAPI